MDDYRKSVEAARCHRNGTPVLKNWSNEHASVILEHLFLAANHTVKIVTNCAAAEVYDQPHVLAAAETFLQRPDVSLEMLLESTVISHRPFMVLMQEYADRVIVIQVPPSLRDTYSYNFF